MTMFRKTVRSSGCPCSRDLHQYARRALRKSRARLVPIHAATLSSEIAARIEVIAARVGDRFKKGDVLVSFDCALPNAQLTHAQAALTEAARTLEIDRRAAAQKTTTPLELDIPAAEVLKAKSDLAAAETLVSKCSIAAPFAGVTVEQKMRPFEYATPGQPVIEVVDDRALEVEMTVPAALPRMAQARHAVSAQGRRIGQDLPGKARQNRRPGRSGQPVGEGDRGGHGGGARAFARRQRPRHPDPAIAADRGHIF